MAKDELHTDELDDDDDDLLLVETDGFDDDDHSGLEVDDRQAQEVERIFLTTLPQYLEPVEEMVDQLMSTGEDPGGEIKRALGATLSSLSAAAARMGIDDIFAQLDLMAKRVEQLDLDAGLPSAEDSQEIYAALKKITTMVIAGDEPSEGGGSDTASQTIFAALAGVEGIDDSVLSKLTAAGVVNIDQLRIADPDEIVAVSGLDATVVAKILAGLGEAAAPAQVDGADEGDEGHDADDEAPLQNVVELPLHDGSLRSQLEHRLRAEVEVEAAAREVTAKVQRLRARASELRADLRKAERRRDQRLEELASAGERLSGQMAERGRLRARRGELALKVADSEETWRKEEQRIQQLQREDEAARDVQARFSRDVAGLAEQVKRLLESAMRR